MSDDNEVCGAWMVTEVAEGYPYRMRWCDRTAGPCPFPGAQQSKDHGDRRCGALPGRVLRVTYGEDRLQAALAHLTAYADDGIADAPLPKLYPETVFVAVDALRACLGDDPT